MPFSVPLYVDQIENVFKDLDKRKSSKSDVNQAGEEKKLEPEKTVDG